MYTVGILTVSDTASGDATKDSSGPLLAELLPSSSYNVMQRAIVPDELEAIQSKVKEWADSLELNLVLLTGGTGFAPRDTTPEAIEPLLTRPTPGLTHLILAKSVAITPMAALSRPVTGIRHKTLIVTFPGSPKACRENLDALLPVLPHGLDLLLDNKSKAGHHHHHRHNHEHAKPRKNHHAEESHHCVHHHRHDTVSAPLGTDVPRRKRTSPYEAIPMDEAERRVAEAAKPLSVIENAKLEPDLAGHVLANDVYAREPVPAYRASIVDGYAVQGNIKPGIYRVAPDAALATSSTQKSPAKDMDGQVIVRIATGGLVPNGYDAVIMVEDTKLIEASQDGKQEIRVELLCGAESGQYIREVGSDCQVGECVGYAGQAITSVGGELGVLASVGIQRVAVYRKPRVGVLSTGDEVVDPHGAETLTLGQIRDSNRITLLSAIQTAGYTAVDLGIAQDNAHAIGHQMRSALDKVDVLITTGGVSMGEADYIKPIVEHTLGATIRFGRIWMKPGKPTTFAVMPSTGQLLFGLPGNPASAIVTFYLFVLPALRKMAGYTYYQNTEILVKLADSVSLDTRPEYHRVRVSADLVAHSTGGQRSSRIMSLHQANGLLKLPSRTTNQSRLEAGTQVPCILIGPLNPV
ncbi:MoaB/Mog domain-containing protein [Syncephalastrum racemosum]|uniref:MoaB/Mog domain-containing protein n=1 Tax=Syncephalastrum racemosum TaxID=13706 RepID=A0A1X2H9X4_SYNRA|nr:MoaB/Mog domain-containing protein [Syncephalastrum racemosum]